MLQLVLTGGPCGGKTTGQARLATFFENLGWKGRLSNSLSSSGLIIRFMDQISIKMPNPKCRLFLKSDQ
jgi:hypothetical protein